MFKSVTIVLTLISFVAAVVITMVVLTDSESYHRQRNLLLEEEKSTFFGHKITLTTKELKADKILLAEKVRELSAGYKNSSKFLPAVHFFQAKNLITRSEVFQFIRRIPKGASLHTHMLAAVSVDFLIKNVSYRENLYGGYINGVFKLKFLSNQGQDDRCNWTLIKDMRKDKGYGFDEWLREQLMLNVEKPRESYAHPEVIWTKFKKVFTTVYDMLCYRPVFEEYITRLLQELYDDNIFYTELKGTIMPLQELEGTTYSKHQFFEIFIETVNRFNRDHPEFIGVRYIHSIYRGVDQEVLSTGLMEIIEIKKVFPNFIAGFDFVGYEEEGNTLLDYIPQLLNAQEHLKFFFHAGETPWFGYTDLNMADAILLNSFRIGHGLALTKHPKLLQLGKERNIPVELCPISNQVLMVNDDPRNHPAVTLLALDYPVIIGNDDPSIWNATGLSYDWYIVFMAMTPKTSGLEVLKQLAINSIEYSAMEEQEKWKAMDVWRRQWDAFVDEILEKHAMT